MALLMLSPGVPMITGGDEFLRSQNCNNNAFNLDNAGNWLNWQAAESAESQAFTSFMRALLSLRREHSVFRPTTYWTYADHNENGMADARWYTDAGVAADPTYMTNASNRFLALLLDGSEASDTSAAAYVAYNGATIAISATLPTPPPGHEWVLVLDTSVSREMAGNANLSESLAATLDVAPRSLAVAIAQPTPN